MKILKTRNVSKGHKCPHMKNVKANASVERGRRRTDGRTGEHYMPLPPFVGHKNLAPCGV